MPYSATRRLHNVVAKKVSRYFAFMKAKRMYNEISRDISILESKFIRSKLGQI